MKIDKNIPIPDPLQKGRRPLADLSLDRMQVRDSVKVPDGLTEKQVKAHLVYKSRTLKKKFRVAEHEGELRVWRVK